MSEEEEFFEQSGCFQCLALIMGLALIRQIHLCLPIE